MKNRCRFPGCTARVHESKALCLDHWIKLPMEARKRLQAVYVRGSCRVDGARYRRMLAEAIAAITGH
jgi:hypothetical protein